MEEEPAQGSGVNDRIGLQKRLPGEEDGGSAPFCRSALMRRGAPRCAASPLLNPAKPGSTPASRRACLKVRPRGWTAQRARSDHGRGGPCASRAPGERERLPPPPPPCCCPYPSPYRTHSPFSSLSPVPVHPAPPSCHSACTAAPTATQVVTRAAAGDAAVHPLPLPPVEKWTRLVHPSVLIGHITGQGTHPRSRAWPPPPAHTHAGHRGFGANDRAVHV